MRLASSSGAADCAALTACTPWGESTGGAAGEHPAPAVSRLAACAAPTLHGAALTASASWVVCARSAARGLVAPAAASVVFRLHIVAGRR